MISSRLLPYLLCGLGAFLGFANNVLHLPPLALGLPAGLAWLAFRAASFKQAFKRGFIGGLAACLVCLYWIVNPVHVYGGLPLALALPCPVLVSMVLALYYALFTALLYLAARRLSPVMVVVFAAPVWAGLEMLAGVLFSGFPWMSLASAMAFWPAMVQGASLVGAYALSGLWAALAVAATLGVTLKGPRLAAIVLLAALLAPAAWTLPNPPAAAGDAAVGLAQGNIDQSLKWDDSYQRATVERYLDLSRSLLKKHELDLLVWPETAMPFYLQESSPMTLLAKGFAKQHGVPLLAGSPGYKRLSPKKFVLFNRAYLIGPDGGMRGFYDKRHLVPFGEYVPFDEILPLGKLVTGVGDFIPGRDAKALRSGKLSLGLLICYEAIFPELAQDLAAQGANLLVNISNDAWFGDTSAPRQHLSHAVLRCVEQSRAMVRATNTGISVLIGPRGRILDRTPQFRAAVLAGELPLVEQSSVFHAVRGVLRPAVIAAALLFIGVVFSGSFRQRTSRRRESD
jgi:apolipoprotein N-acyltransferase